MSRSCIEATLACLLMISWYNKHFVILRVLKCLHFIQLEVSLPTRQGRRDILEIHMRTMTERGHVARDVNIDQLAEMAEGFTGAEMEGVVKAGASFALERALSSGDMT